MTSDKDLLPLKFAEREFELTKIRVSDSIYMVIDSPPGYGKTYLLEEVKKRLKDEWQCVIVNLKQDQGKFAIRRAITELIGAPQIPGDDDQEADRLLTKALGSAGKIILAFDSVENATKEDRKWLFDPEGFVKNCEISIPGGFRVIVAGNYAGVSIPILPKNCKPIRLTPFSPKVIEQFLLDAFEQHPPPLELKIDYKTLALRIIRLSGGHPRSIQRLVTDLAKEERWIINFPQQEKKLFNDHIAGEINLIIGGLDVQMRRVLEILSVFRIFDDYMVQTLQKVSLSEGFDFPPGVDPKTIRDTLTKFGFIAKKEKYGPFYFDTIVRNILLTRIRIQHPDVYRVLNIEAQKIYDTSINILIKQIQKPHEQFNDFQTTLDTFVDESVNHSIQYFLGNHSLADEITLCLRKHRNYLVDGLQADDNDPECEVKIMDMIAGDEETQNVLEECGINFQTLQQIILADQSTAGVNHANDGEKNVKHNFGDWFMNTLDALQQPFINALIERWEKRNEGRGITPLQFYDQDQMRQRFNGLYPSDEVLEKKLRAYKFNDSYVLINESHLKHLREQVEQAQETIDLYKVALEKPLPEKERIQLASDIHERRTSLDKAVEELVDIYAYLYS